MDENDAIYSVLKRRGFETSAFSGPIVTGDDPWTMVLDVIFVDRLHYSSDIHTNSQSVSKREKDWEFFDLGSPNTHA